MAYAMIAGLPPVYGLYAALVPQLVYGVCDAAASPVTSLAGANAGPDDSGTRSTSTPTPCAPTASRSPR